MTCKFCFAHGVDLKVVVDENDVFHNLSLFEDYANTIVGNDDVKNEFSVN